MTKFKHLKAALRNMHSLMEDHLHVDQVQDQAYFQCVIDAANMRASTHHFPTLPWPLSSPRSSTSGTQARGKVFTLTLPKLLVLWTLLIHLTLAQIGPHMH
ncbi:hypothetical protein BCR44DRAFT_1436905 [Catenaria anguillulae PL171]|uniref:Uncharacterized protein n=2 Tax=Catenaria anguillulae PL171 TaxID=765915 RepID=A0A1Y2HI39_9FUNG|nr:hypothetical protein BCR44DRAFT_1436905 [Catenaria anguillulae PL171]